MEMKKVVQEADLTQILYSLVSDRILLSTGERPAQITMDDGLFLDDFDMENIVNDIETAFGCNLSPVRDKVPDMRTVGDFYREIKEELPVVSNTIRISKSRRPCLMTSEYQNG